MGSRGLGRAALLRAGPASVQTQGPVTSDNHSEWVGYVRILRDAWKREPGKKPDFLKSLQIERSDCCCFLTKESVD